MNKMLLFTIFIVLIGSQFAFAMEPCPLAFKFLTSPPDSEGGLHVMVSYKDQSWTGIVDTNGELVMDLGTKGIPNCIYQNFDLVVLECEDNPVCHKTVSFNSQGYTIIDIREAWLKPFEEPTTTTIECEPCICEECKPCICEECECPEEENPFIVISAFLALVAGGFGVYAYKGKLYLNKKNIENLVEAMPKGCGIRLFKAYSGKSDIKHYHRSPLNYHSLDKRHKGKYDHEGEKNLFPDFGGD